MYGTSPHGALPAGGGHRRRFGFEIWFRSEAVGGLQGPARVNFRREVWSKSLVRTMIDDGHQHQNYGLWMIHTLCTHTTPREQHNPPVRNLGTRKAAATPTLPGSCGKPLVVNALCTKAPISGRESGAASAHRQPGFHSYASTHSLLCRKLD